MFVPFAVFVSVGLQLARVAVAQDDNDGGGGNAPLTIVGLFDSENSVEQQMFELAVQKVNIDPMFSDVYLNAKIQMVDSSDSYKTGVKVCETMESGVAAVFGPSRLDSSNIVQSTCETMQVPRVETSWETTPVEHFDYYFNLYPEPTLLSRGYTAIIRDYDWKSFTLLYQHPECLQRLQDLIQHYSRETKPNDNHAAAISIIQLPESRDFRTVLKGIKKSLEGHIVLDCDVELIPTVLKQAKEVNLLDDYHHFIITTLDAHTVEFGGIVQNLRANITTVRLIDPTCPLVRNIVQDLNFVRQRMNMDTAPLSADKLTVGAMLMHDAVNVYARTVKGLSGRVAAERLRCANGPHTIWSDGYKLINFMRVIETEGLSGLLRFDTKTGHRSYFTLEMVQLVETGFKKIIGLWNPEKGMTYTRTTDEMVQDSYKINKNKTFVVSTKITEPYLMLKENHADLEGNDKYEGYVVDLIEMIAKEINITYEFSLTNEGNGKRDKKTNKWNGIIGQVQSTAADLGVCDLTITHERRTAVDFTMPFMNLGISILFSKPEEPQTNLFSFTQPLSFQVWIFTATAYLGLSLILFFLARITPNEWQNPHPCNPRPEELENSLSLLNCLWFSLGSILCQGSDILPRAFPTRLCAAMWWFFALIMTQSYTANWTAFLTSNRMATTIQNVEDLDKKGGTEGGIKYGCVTDQSTASFFQNSDVNLYQKMWSTMEQNGASVMVSNNNEGVDRVKKERNHYAFFMESSSIEYEVQRNCDLTEVGYWLDNKAYGIAMPFNAQHRTAVDLAVLKLSEAGTLMELKNKWWEVSEDKKCKDSQKGSEELDVNELGGMFVILVLGCLIAFLFSILEFLWNIRKVAVEEKLTLWEAFRVELKFVLKCHGTSKPVRHAVDSSSDT